MKCKRRPIIRSYDVPASPASATIWFSRDTVAFVIRPRTPVGFTISIGDSVSPTGFFSIGAAEAYSEEDMQLAEGFALTLAAASGVVVEVWTWEG